MCDGVTVIPKLTCPGEEESAAELALVGSTCELKKESFSTGSTSSSSGSADYDNGFE
jgi:hypothetical protein